MPRIIKSTASVEKITSGQFNIMTDYRPYKDVPNVKFNSISIEKKSLYLHPYVGFIVAAEPGKDHKGHIDISENGAKVIYEFSIKKNGTI